MNRILQALIIAIVFVAPFGEGGRAPWSLFVLHSLAIGVIVLIALRPATRATARRAGVAGSLVRGLAAGLGLSAVAALRASYPLAAGLGLWDLAVPAGLFLALLRSPADARPFERLRAAVAFSSLLQASLAIVRWSRADGLGAGALSAGASFLNPDHLGGFLNLGLVLWLASALDAMERTEKRAITAGLAAAAVHLLAILVLMSRGALVGLAAALVLLFARRWRSGPGWGRVIAAGALGLVLLLGSGMVALRFARSADPYRYHRLQIWRASAGMLAERPLFGYGPGMFPYEGPRHNFPNEVGPFRYEKIFSGGHSALLTLAVENGVPAATCFLFVTLLVVGRLLRRRDEGGGGTAEAAIGIGLVALLVQGLFEDLQERPALLIIPAILAGTALGLRHRAGLVARAGGRGGEIAVTGGSLAGGPDDACRFFPAPLVLLAAIYLFGIAVASPYWADREARISLQLGRSGVPGMERARALNPWHPDYSQSLAMAVLNSGAPTAERYARAANLLREARRLDPADARLPLLLGRLEGRVAAGLFVDRTVRGSAIRLYEEAARLSPCDPRPLLELAGFQMEGGATQEALGSARSALQIEPNFVRARILEATCLLGLAREREARASYARLEESLRLLRGQGQGSGYAADLAADAPSERIMLKGRLAPGDEIAAPGPAPDPTTR